MLRKLADLLVEKSEHLGRIESVDTGKMLKETRWQAKYIAEFFQFYAGCADKIVGEVLPIDKPDMFVFTDREPLGVVAAVVPWNSQLFLVAVKIGPALAAGNTVVLKASEHASAALLEFGALIEQAGFPPGVVNIVTGHGDPCGKVLTSHPKVARISFSGGPGAAKHVLYNSAENFAEVSLEMGSKSPFIVFDDANSESAVSGSIAGIFGATGQSCVAGSRLYLHEDIADAFLERIAELPSLDILVNNIGTNRPQPFVEVSDANLDLMIDMNIRTTFRISRTAARLMEKGASMVNITSQMGHVGSPGRTVYCMTKHAIEGLTKAAAVELAPRGIRVNSVAPTFIETPMTKPMLDDPEFAEFVKSMIPLGTIGQPEDVAAAVLYLCSDGAAMVTGHSLLVDGGWTAQ